MQCGLLGEKLGHSYSPQIHGCLADYDYALFEKRPDELEAFLKNGDFTGLNVTIPYKKSVIPYLSELSPTAQRLGAVNTIVRRPDGTLIGHNSDYFGFRSMVEKSGLVVSGKKVLVLGSGGASNTAVAVLQELGAKVVVISRSGENNYDNLHLHNDAAVIVNATPVGMYPNVGNAPVCLGQFPALEGVLDIVYNPARTQLLLDAEKRGLVTMNGLWMLVAQAKESAEWFTGVPIPDSSIETIHKKLRLQMENIILIGMPGSGKSTVGKQLAQALGKELVDADAEIVKLCGMPIPEIFAKGGEECFRQAETQVLSQLGKRSGLIIATGGGCVTRAENYPLLHQNGSIFWIKRDIEKLPTDGRPLSQSGKLQQMYQIRKPMYERFADHTVSNDGALESTIQTIIHILEGSI
ncbi:MAG: AAA family ATPase [Oscillospiraceae bacterium]|nr:AAA family ATPase [Oscillospiraceae bacterium]